MSVTVRLAMYKGFMPRNRRNRKMLNVDIDNSIIMDIGWGETATFSVPAGRHDLTVRFKAGIASNTLSIQGGDGDTVRVSCFHDRETGRVTLVDETNGTAVDGLRALTQNQRAHGRAYAGVFAAAVFLLSGGASAILLPIIMARLPPVSPRVTAQWLELKTIGPYLVLCSLPYFVLAFFVYRKSLIALFFTIAVTGMSILASLNFTLGLLSAMSRVKWGFLYAPLLLLCAGYILLWLWFLALMVSGIGGTHALRQERHLEE